MKAILLVNKSPDMQQFGHDAMANSVGISDLILKDAKDGDQVDATVKGTLMEHGGMRYISIDQVDGEDVEDPEDMADHNMDEGSQDQSLNDRLGTTSEDALMNYMKTKGK